MKYIPAVLLLVAAMSAQNAPSTNKGDDKQHIEWCEALYADDAAKRYKALDVPDDAIMGEAPIAKGVSCEDVSNPHHAEYCTYLASLRRTRAAGKGLEQMIGGSCTVRPLKAQRSRHLDIPAISREANGAIVSIVMSDKDGHPIAKGSGFFISKDGHVLTNYHVIRNGSSAVIKLPNGAFFAVDGVLASDKNRDVAIIKAHGNDFRTLTLGDSDRLQVGEEVVAIGNPLSLESTVSNGIVSAVRTIEAEGGKFLQITAPISHGSSGGPLFNMAGEVVGITTSGYNGGGNLNFAIPINDVKPMLVARLSNARALPDEPEADEKAEATIPAQPENNHCDEEYDSLKRNIIAIVGVQRKNLPPAVLAQITEHNKRCTLAVVPDHILQQEKADAEARAQKAQHEAEIEEVRADMLAQWKRKVASDPFVPPVEGWMHVGPQPNSSAYIILPGKGVTSDCRLSYRVLDCLGATGRNEYFAVQNGHRWYLLKSKRSRTEGDYAGTVKDGGSTICFRNAGCYHVLAEFRPAPTEAPEELSAAPTHDRVRLSSQAENNNDWRLRSYVNGVVTVEQGKNVYIGACEDTKIGSERDVRTIAGDCSRLATYQGKLFTTCVVGFRGDQCAARDGDQFGFLINLDRLFWVIEFKILSGQQTE
jgi:S1-C subfamily serine protease